MENKLTDRQLQVMQLRAEGKTLTDIAETLLVSYYTVKSHARNAMYQLGADTAEHAIAILFRNGMLK